MRSGRSLNVQALPRDDSGPPSEVGARRQKFAAFENACSEVAPGLCVGGGAVAQASTMCSLNVAVAPHPCTQQLSLIRRDMLTCHTQPWCPCFDQCYSVL